MLLAQWLFSIVFSLILEVFSPKFRIFAFGLYLHKSAFWIRIKSKCWIPSHIFSASIFALGTKLGKNLTHDKIRWKLCLQTLLRTHFFCLVKNWNRRVENGFREKFQKKWENLTIVVQISMWMPKGRNGSIGLIKGKNW